VITAARGRRQRAILATLFFSQGIPMMLAGDEIGNSQRGNNNAYAQDNETGWVDWKHADEKLLAYVRRLSELRRRYPVLSQRNFLHSRPRPADDLPDLEWHHPEGRAPTDADWQNHVQAMGVVMRASAETLTDSGAEEVFAVYNAGPAREIVLPDGKWVRVLDSANPGAPEKPVDEIYKAAEQSVVLFAHPEKPTR
jgi:glycogen operon protein